MSIKWDLGEWVAGDKKERAIEKRGQMGLAMKGTQTVRGRTDTCSDKRKQLKWVLLDHGNSQTSRKW
ncbi:hypothetical protein QQP08_014822 [Theobroma cacao]|nr:hypothetical protein QQP08_014622 [Theobroma cacao]WRX22335.1 hypothetical protein QQP08_014822 [Theobroma cacao]